jgi:hypothetical protein
MSEPLRKRGPKRNPLREPTVRGMLEAVLALPKPLGDRMRERVAESLAARCQQELGLRIQANSVFVGDVVLGVRGTLRLNDAVVRQIAPDLCPCYFPPDPEHRLTVERLLESDNEEAPDEATRDRYADLPWEVRNRALRHERPPLELLHHRHASLFVAPDSHLAFDAGRGTEIPRLSFGAVPRAAVVGPVRKLDSPAVLIRDTFLGGNMSHILFDWLPRILHFIQARPALSRRVLYVMGGVRPPIEKFIMEGLRRVHRLRPAQFLTVTRPGILEPQGGLYGLSTHGPNCHPLNLTHPRTVALVREFLAAQPLTAGTERRIYISRGDANRRRLLNEEALMEALRRRGFVSVQLSKLPLEEQMGLVAGAEAVVGIHGMGLTHIIHHRGQPAIVELFPNRKGTFAYGAVARALGFPYRHVVGPVRDEASNDFEVNVDQVMAALDALGVA